MKCKMNLAKPKFRSISRQPQTDNFYRDIRIYGSFLPQYKRHDVVGRCRNEISDARSV